MLQPQRRGGRQAGAKSSKKAAAHLWLVVDSHREAAQHADARAARDENERRSLQSDLDATHAALRKERLVPTSRQPSPRGEIPIETSESLTSPQWSLDTERSSAQDLLHEPPCVTTHEIESGGVQAIWENQRRSLVPVFGSADYSAKRLGRTDRCSWSFEDNQVRA